MNRYSRFHDQCGHPVDLTNGPVRCEGCGNGVWANPTPIGVALIPVLMPTGEGQSHKIGILIGRRNHEPMMGQWGLPGGFINDIPEGETILQGAIRELEEETGIKLSHRENDFRYLCEYANPEQAQSLVFFHYVGPRLEVERDVTVGPSTVSAECSELDIAWSPRPLCFSSHTIALQKWFRSAL